MTTDSKPEEPGAPGRAEDKVARRKMTAEVWATIGAIATVLALLLAAFVYFFPRGDIAPPQGASSSRTFVTPSPVKSGKPIDDLASFEVFQHYSPRGFIGDIGDIKKEQEPGTGLTRFIYEARGREPHEWEHKYEAGQLNPDPCKFAGILFLDGDWGRESGRGYDLRSRRTIRWEARSLGDPVFVEFFAGGAVWVWDEQTQKRVEAPYPDSLRRESIEHARLTEAWQSFSWKITSTEDDLRAVIAPFGWIITWDSNGVEASRPKTFTIEIRRISYER